MKTKHFLLGVASLLLASCTNELELPVNEAWGGNSNLSINVLTTPPDTKGLVTDSYLPASSEIGVTVTNTSGGNYDGTAYNNIKFTATGTGTGQTWSGASTVNLSATDGYCYAYYPYSSSASTITAIPVTAGETDYLYATKVTVNDKDKNATLNMKHALSAISFALKKGTYGGTGKVTAVSVTSSALGSSGKLNATTGAVTAANTGAAVSHSANLTLSTTAQNVDVVMVPSGSAGTITLSVTIDGKAYSTTVSSTTIAQGSCYTYTLTVNAGALALSGVQIGDWGYNDGGAPTITAAGYTVTIAGDYTDIALINSVSGGTVTIEALNKQGFLPNAVTASGTVTLSQSVSGNIRTITLSSLASNVTLTFNGSSFSGWMYLADGVYAIDNDGNAVAYATANAAASGTFKGVAFVLKGKAYQVAKVNATGYDGAETVYWHKTGYSDISGIKNFTLAEGTKSSGYLAETGTPQLSRDPASWTSGAFSDFNGQANTVTILAAQSDGTLDYTIGKAVMDFRSGSNNEGYTDWFIPSCGELAFMFLKKTELNTLLGKVSGSTFSSSYYWSSSEYSAYGAWNVSFSNGSVRSSSKYYNDYVRLVRAI